MTAAGPAKSLPSSQASKTDEEDAQGVQSTRETVESVVVAFILAFLFRAFVAEAFVIPTGSMAPTLMGAHKDIFCEYCGQQYPASASQEFNSNNGNLTGDITVASTCSTCRGLNAYDLRNNPDHGSFSGDRILVSKFDYVLSSPSRWDVFVFKYPSAARMNYIKRLVGLPGESLLIDGGDIYTKTQPDDPWLIARKPPAKIRAMRQIVSDTDYQAEILIEKGWPSLWQPWSSQAAATAWNVEQTSDGWSASLPAGPTPEWLRYFHKFPDDSSWLAVKHGAAPPQVDPYASQLITDYLAYNSSYVSSQRTLYENGELREGIDSERRALDWLLERGRTLESLGKPNDGLHWVGDLVGEFEVQVESDSGTLMLDLIEYGIHHECAIDIATGKATLRLQTEEGESLPFTEAERVQGQTEMKGAGAYTIEFANFDDQLVLWVDGKVVELDSPATFDSRSARAPEDRRPHWSESDPLDAAPVGIGAQDLALRVERAKVYRDIYYIAVQNVRSNDYSDYDLHAQRAILAAVPDRAERERVATLQEAISLVYSNPRWWSDTSLFGLRGQLQFELEEEQYFPLGDNSAASLDARGWLGHNFVEEKFLLGKALLVFWPHTWNTPVPFTPNFSRMGFIR